MQINTPGAHIDHMLRQTRMHNMQLSMMADMKASMLLTVASLVLGLSLSQLAKDPQSIIFILLVVSSVLTVILAIYATMPNVGANSERKKSRIDQRNNSFTLLFFGDYTNLSYEEYEKEMEIVMSDVSATYQAQVKELYNMGCYLAKSKFRRLRLAYLAFLIGIVSSAIFACVQYSYF